MSRLIDKGTLKSVIRNEFPDLADRIRINNIINEQPTIELIYCKNCDHWDKTDNSCTIRDSYGWNYKPDDYCSYAVKKEDTDEL